MEHDEKIKIENHFEAGSMTNCNVFTGTVNGGVFPLPGSQPTINNFYGGEKPHQEPKAEEVLPEEIQEETPEKETSEERAKRKEDVMNTITALFDFDDKVLCKDNNGNRITNERLAMLFRRCFGFGAHLGREQMAVIDALWVLLIDKRNQCFKHPNEDYFRQTVLNILGYYQKKGLINCNKSDILHTIYMKADESLSKNIERGISSNVFPERTGELLDLYIDKLKKGEF